MLVAGAFAVTACGSDGGAGGSVQAFCAALEELDASEGIEFPFVGDPETLDELIDHSQSLSEAVADAAPEEISDEADIAFAALVKLFDALRALDDPTDQDEVQAAFEDSAPGASLGDSLGFAALRREEAIAERTFEALDTYSAYAEEECGIGGPDVTTPGSLESSD